MSQRDHGHQVFGRSQSSVSWSPRDGPSSQLISLSDYQVFHKIGRTVHLNDYRQLQMKQCLSPQKLGSQSKSYLLQRETDLQILWFGPVDSKEESNFYGNVTFNLDIVKLMDYCQKSFNLYFVEVMDYKTCNATRILISRKNYDYLPKYDPTAYGSPWHIDPIGKHYWLRNSRRYDGKTNDFGHTLELMLEFEPNDATWLYKESVAIPVNHHEANSGKKRKCNKYGIHSSCPSPFSKEITEKHMTTPNQPLTNGDLGATPEESFENNNNNENDETRGTPSSPEVNGDVADSQNAGAHSVRRTLF